MQRFLLREPVMLSAVKHHLWVLHSISRTNLQITGTDKIASRMILVLTTLAVRDPRGPNFVGAARDLSLQVLSKAFIFL